jgi:Mn2+/Fe2+ NRAMP family transporter
MIMLVNNKKIMGEYTNKPINNIIGWVTIVILVALSGLLMLLPLFS